jgi:tRNA modification GTPase
MNHPSDTIVALSSGQLPSGVAVLRLSGPRAVEICLQMAGPLPEPRKAYLRRISSLRSGEVLDSGLVMLFPGPASFTGEDCAELHVHGGRAVVEAVLSDICSAEGVRLAEAGEFSRRAFENGKMDLTEVEGLADLIACETEAQRRLALSQAGGVFRKRLEAWRDEIIRCRALIEAELDFADEDDVPGGVSEQVWARVQGLADSIAFMLDDGRAGEIVRDGFRVVLMGEPNAGKSSLLNALARREVAIVSEEAGTTRDLIEVHLNLGGIEVVVTDTAGVRETSSKVESEGIRRANEAAERADLVLWLVPSGDAVPAGIPANAVIVHSKGDLSGSVDANGLSVSVRSEGGIDGLLELLLDRAGELTGRVEPGIVTRQRHRDLLVSSLGELKMALEVGSRDITLSSEHLRRAGDLVGRVTGRIDVEDLLDVIFSEFCIGK